MAVSDEICNSLWSSQVREIKADLIVSCGDLRNDYLEYLLTVCNVPLLYVFGNHDTSGPEGGTCIDGKIYNHDGIKLMGLGGSMRYREGINMYSEREMSKRANRLRFRAWLANGIDILVTHAPAKNWGDLNDLAHRGFDTFNKIITKYKPKIMLHGHIHFSYGIIKRGYIHTSGTRIYNVCGYKIIDL